jgi:hypothetical protein
MPAPASTESCGFCLNAFPSEGGATFNLVSSGDTYMWTSDRGPIAIARRESGLWHLFDAHTGERELTLVAIELDNSIRVALLDSWLRTLATVVVDPDALPRRAPGSKRGLGSVRNRKDETVLAVYGDGPTGVHLVNREQDVVALASPVTGRRAGLDVLVTNDTSAPAPVTLGGVLLALELARAGQLRPVS